MDSFFIGEHRCEVSDSGVWVFPRNRGRGRFFPNGTSVAESVRAGDKEIDPETHQRTFKPGTHEPVYYLRNEHGEVGIPPEPGLPIPAGSTLHEATSLQEIDSITREMNRDLRERFYDDGFATKMIDKVLGDPIETLKRQMEHPVSRMERDVIPLLIQDLERMEEERRHVFTEMHFRERER